MEQHTPHGLGEVDAVRREGTQRRALAPHVPRHARRLAQEGGQIHVHRLVAEERVAHLEVVVVGGDADHRERAALALAQRAEEGKRRGRDREDVALLRLVRPDLARGHPRLLVGSRAQVDPGAAAGAVGELGKRVGEAARPDVVDGEDRVVLPQRAAAVDHLLRPPLDLGVAALDGVEVEVRGVGAGGHGGGRPAAHADEHPGAPELDEQRARRHLALVRVPGAHVADAARQHDRLVVAPRGARHLLLVDAEVAGEVGAAELVVEGGGPDRAFDHDGERGGDAVGARLRAFPGPLVPRDPEARHREAAQARLRLRAATGRALVADLAPRAGGGAGEGRDRRRVVVGLDLHEGVREVVAVEVASRAGVHQEAPNRAALHDRGVVRVGADRSAGARLLRLLDHLEERLRHRLPVHDPGGVEDLVAAVLRVRLGEHRELDVGGVAPLALEVREEVVDLVRCQGQAHRRVRLLDGDAAAGEHVDLRQRPRGDVTEEDVGLVERREDGLRHAVVEEGQSGGEVSRVTVEVVRRATLDAAHEAGEPALAGDVGGLGRPGRDRAGARRDEDHPATRAAPGAEPPGRSGGGGPGSGVPRWRVPARPPRSASAGWRRHDGPLERSGATR